MQVVFQNDVHAKGKYQRTPLHLASDGGHSDVVQVLIKNGLDVNAKDNHQETPFHLASEGMHGLRGMTTT